MGGCGQCAIHSGHGFPKSCPAQTGIQDEPLAQAQSSQLTLSSWRPLSQIACGRHLTPWPQAHNADGTGDLFAALLPPSPDTKPFDAVDLLGVVQLPYLVIHQYAVLPVRVQSACTWQGQQHEPFSHIPCCRSGFFQGLQRQSCRGVQLDTRHKTSLKRIEQQDDRACRACRCSSESSLVQWLAFG